MDDEQAGGQAPGMPESRTGAFSAGLTQTGEKFNSASEKFNYAVPKGFTQNSVLQQGMPSANGMSATDYQRILPGVNQGGRPYILPSQNGTSSNNWEKTTYMRLQGRNVI